MRLRAVNWRKVGLGVRVSAAKGLGNRLLSTVRRESSANASLPSPPRTPRACASNAPANAPAASPDNDGAELPEAASIQRAGPPPADNDPGVSMQPSMPAARGAGVSCGAERAPRDVAASNSPGDCVSPRLPTCSPRFSGDGESRAPPTPPPSSDNTRRSSAYVC